MSTSLRLVRSVLLIPESHSIRPSVPAGRFGLVPYNPHWVAARLAASKQRRPRQSGPGCSGLPRDTSVVRSHRSSRYHTAVSRGAGIVSPHRGFRASRRDRAQRPHRARLRVLLSRGGFSRLRIRGNKTGRSGFKIILSAEKRGKQLADKNTNERRGGLSSGNTNNVKAPPLLRV